MCAYNTEVTIQKVQDVSQKMRESLENYRQTLKRLLVWFGLEGGRTGLGCLFVKCCLLSVFFSQNCTKSTIYIHLTKRDITEMTTWELPFGYCRLRLSCIGSAVVFPWRRGKVNIPPRGWTNNCRMILSFQGIHLRSSTRNGAAQ